MIGTQVVALNADGVLETVYGMNQGDPNDTVEDQAKAFARVAGVKWASLSDSVRAKVIAATAEYQLQYEVAKRDLWSVVRGRVRRDVESEPTRMVVCVLVRQGSIVRFEVGDDPEVDFCVRKIASERTQFRSRLMDCLK